MADPAVQKLRDAFANAPAGPVVLNDGFWTAAGLVSPANFTDAIKAAYRLPASAPGLSVEYDRANVSPVTDGAFEIPGVAMAFLAPGSNPVTVITGASGTPTTPLLGIDVTPQGWQLDQLFPAMAPANAPFGLLVLDQQRFYFASALQTFSWSDQGVDLVMAPGQNLYGMLTVPAAARPLFAVLSNLPVVPNLLPMVGPIALDKANNDDILYPDMALRAMTPSASDLSIWFINVRTPRLGLSVTTAYETTDEDGALLLNADGAPEGEPVQSPLFFFGVEIALQAADGSELPFLLEAGVRDGGKRYQFSIGPNDIDKPITPAAVIALMSGGESSGYFQLLPPLLQQYLTSIQMEGFTVDGPLTPSIGVSGFSVVMGSVQDAPIPFFSDPTNSQAFALDSFQLTWRLSKRGTSFKSTGLLEANFQIFPEIFRTKDGQPGGLFEISIDTDMNFEGAFTGKASLDDVLNGISGGAIGLPEGVSIDFSDIYLKVSPSRKSYALGFQVDAFVDVPFVQYTDPVTGESKPLIQINGLNFDLQANTPNRTDGQPGKTVYAASMDGQIVVGPVATDIRVDYDGTLAVPLWTIDAALAQPLVLSDMLDQFFRAYDLPSFLPGTLSLDALAVKAKIPVAPKAPTAALAGTTAGVRPARRALDGRGTGGWRSRVRPLDEASPHHLLAAAPTAGAKSAYSVSTRIRWSFDLTSDIHVDTLAELAVDYDASRPVGQEFNGSAIGSIDVNQIGPLQIGYRFGPPTNTQGQVLPPVVGQPPQAAPLSNSILWMGWKGVRAEYNLTTCVVSFSLSGWSVGSLITTLVEMIGDPYFELPAPWNILNSISLNGLALQIDLKTGVQNRVSAVYSLPSPINLGFMKIQGLTFKQVDGKVTLAIAGTTTVPGMQNQPLFNPNSTGQDVRNMPTVPGRGNSYFDLRLLALGQRIAIGGQSTFRTTQQVIKALEAIPSSSGPKIPFDPSTPKPGQPYYNRDTNWLGALHFGLMQIPGTTQYTIDFMVVFNDPDLYGLRLALNGDKVKVLSGLAIDVLYKKVTDDVGCYQIEFALPSALRNLDFGAFAVTLPVIGLQIYTNGDFLVDFGFPYNMDFSRSFTMQAIILGVPVIGSGGFYFGKLSNATAPNLPVTTKGTFHPVIVFGLGAQLGVGRTIDKGILKAGFSITVFGIIEGTLAAWHPYQIGNSGSPSQVQGDYYFKITGTFGVIGKLYGSIDFAIIKADVSLTVMVYAKITYESFRKIPLSITATVQVHVSVEIDLGIFSFSISLSFSASISESLTIGSDSTAPWDDAPKALAFAGRAPRTLFEQGILGRPLRLNFAKPHAARKAALLAGADSPPLELTAVTQFTILAPEGASYDAQEGGMVMLLMIDAPTAGKADPGGDTGFGRLCQALLPWIIASVEPETDVQLSTFDGQTVSRPLLEGILLALADPKVAPFTAKQLTDFLKANFTFNVSAGDGTLSQARKDQLKAGCGVFPAPDFLSLTVPKTEPAGGVTTIAFDAYATANTAYQATLREIFNSVAANVGAENKPAAPKPLAAEDDPPQSLAASVYTDYFILLARQLIQTSIDAFDDYPYPLTATTSLQTVLDWANGLTPVPQLDALDLAMANPIYPLAAVSGLVVAPLAYMVQTGDTLTAIAGRYPGATPTALVLGNAAQSNLLVPGQTVEIVKDGKTRRHVTVIGDSFDSVAVALDVSTADLSLDQALWIQAGLLAPAIVLTIPSQTLSTTAGDTLAAIAQRLNAPLSALLTPQTLALQGLFKADPTLRFAVPGLAVLPADALWPAVLATGSLGQTAGMATRYMMHGMRLPVAPGLSLPANFLYGAPYWKAQTAYGVYQLTGQQFPFAPANSVKTITLSRPQLDFDWFQLGGGASVPIDVSGVTNILAVVVPAARALGYKPDVPVLAPEPEVILSKRRFGTATFIPWLTSDASALDIATGRTPNPGGSQATPLLMGLSSALTAAVEKTQAALAADPATAGSLWSYLPVLTPLAGVTDPATSETKFTDIDTYSLATRVDFRIKRLAQDADLAPERADANNVTPPSDGNTGSPAQPLAPYAYEIVGPNPGEAMLLERLLTAMNSQGEDLVSDIFLLYGDINNGAQGLTSRATSEFLSFIVQSNLSTETNPPAAQARLAALKVDQPKTGVANNPAEFIKLLWELSTVNSGGTYLFYQLLQEGTGLPPALFDQSGVATLTLVATIRRDSRPLGQRVFNAVNALVTTAPIDPQTSVIELQGVSTPAASQPLATGATLAKLSALYGVEIGALATANATVPLASSRQIPVAGLFHQLLPDDVTVGKDPLATLAAYYSVGAVTPISKADIQAFNPGVAVAALSVFRIPPFVYAVTSTGPGSTLATMAAYYATEVVALGYAARDVADLFQAPTLTIDPVAHDATPNLGLGNAAISMQRERGAAPGALQLPPPPEALKTYTQDTLLQLYQLVSAGMAPNAFFNASVSSAAFGPKEANAPTAAAPGARRLATPLAAPAADAPYIYDQALGFTGPGCRLNAAPDVTNGLPTKADNPYAGVGGLLQMRLAWLDLFGNQTPSPFTLPKPGDPQPFGDTPMALFYPDRLVALDQWPSTTRAYRYGGEAGAPVLSITLKFDPTPYEEPTTPERQHLAARRFGDELPIWQRNAVADLANFRTVYYQLNQSYDGLGVPGLSGPAVTLSLINSLLAQPESALPAAARDQILAYVDAAVLYLTARAAGSGAVAPTDAVIQLAVDPAAVATDRDILQLDLALRMTRQADLVASDLRALNDGVSTTSGIPIDGLLPTAAKAGEDSDDPPYPVGLAQFAADFEKAFVTPNWRLRAGVSSAEPSAPNNARAQTVWAVRMAKADGPTPAGLGFQINGDARYFAPLPIASSLQTLGVAIAGYKTGAPYPDGDTTPVTFTSVDPNVWLAECLTAIDDVLTATYATPMFVLDWLLGLQETPNPDNPPPPDEVGFLTRLLEHKKTLAAAIASTATSVLDQPAGDLRPAAVDKLEQALLQRLSNANTLTCVTVLPVSRAHYAPTLPPKVTAPRFFGQPQATLTGTTAAGAVNENFALSTGKIPLQISGDTSTLAFLFTSRHADSEAFVSLDLAYALSHIEHDIRGVPGIENYEQSRWITFLTGPYVTPITPASGPDFNVPVALRALPTPATVVAQTGQLSPATGVTTPADLRRWDYGFSYLLKQASQDTVLAQVVFNPGATGPSQGQTRAQAAAALYAALAQFTAIYPAVARDLETYLRPLNGTNKPGDPDVTTAQYAVEAFDTVVGAVALAYDAFAKASPTANLLAQAPPRIVYDFEVLLTPDPDPATLDAALIKILPLDFQQAGAPVDNFLPLAKVLIAAQDYAPVLVDSDPKTGAASWRYQRRPEADPTLPEYLPYADALRDNQREVRFEGLDLFALQQGWSSMQVARNRHLSPDPTVKTTQDFQFTTASARFADPLTPLISVDTYALDTGATSAQSVPTWLTNFFGPLLTPDPGITFNEPVLVKLETRYAYPLATGLPPTVLPITLLAPTSTGGASNPPFVVEVGQAAQNWFDTIQPATPISAQFGFGLTVFSATDAASQPLLRVGSLTLQASNVSQS